MARMLRATLIAAMLLLATVSSSRADTPGARLSVNPNSELFDGQTVQVSGGGLGANQSLAVRQCTADGRQCSFQLLIS